MFGAFDLALEGIARLFDGALHPAAFMRRNHAAHGVDLLQNFSRLAFDFIGERLNVIRATQRIDGVGDAELVHHHLLCPQCNAGGPLSGKGERLVQPCREDGLCTPQRADQRMHCNADNVVFGFLAGQGGAQGSAVDAEH